MIGSYMPSDTALRYNAGKPDLSYLLDFPYAFEALCRVMEQGAVKYSRGNWQKGGKPDEEYLGSCLRHLFAGDTYDSDTGCLHIAHAVWNLLALLELNIKNDVAPFDLSFDQEEFRAKYA